MTKQGCQCKKKREKESHKKVLIRREKLLKVKKAEDKFKRLEKETELKLKPIQREKTPEETLEIIDDLRREDATFNIVGKQSVETALKSGIIKQSGITHVEGVPVALSLL